MRFDGVRVVVTGGARGIGRGIVDAFLDEGAYVVATDRLGDALASIRAEHPHADRLSMHAADLEDVEQVHAIVPAAVAAMGGVDVLVNNAGVQPDGPFLDVDATDIDHCFAVNVRAPLLLMRDVCRHLIDRDAAGSIVNIASANAFHNESPEAIYNASKAALVALTKSVAHEMGHHGIRANCVAPGETITPEAERRSLRTTRTSVPWCSATCRASRCSMPARRATRRWRCCSSRATMRGSSRPRRSWSTAARSAAAGGTTTTIAPSATGAGASDHRLILRLAPGAPHRLLHLLDVQRHLEEADLLVVDGSDRPAPSPRLRTRAARGAPTGLPPMDPPTRGRRRERSRRPPRPPPRRRRRASRRCHRRRAPRRSA